MEKDKIKSGLSRNQSATIKGLLILLIMLGHNDLLMTDPASGGKRFVFQWLYSFHVYCFFILPFLYGKKPLSVKRFADNVFRFWISYFWIFMLCLIANALFTKGIMSFSDYFYAFFIGDKPILKEVVGFYFPWFLPAMFSVLLFKGIADHKRWIGMTVFLLSICCQAAYIFDVLPLRHLQSQIPFALVQGVLFFSVAVFGKWLCEMVSRAEQKWNIKWAVLIAFSALSLSFYFTQSVRFNILQFWHFILPPVGFALMFSIRALMEKSQFLRFMGDYSLPIYAFHLFVYNLLEIVLRHFGVIGQHVIVWGVISFAATLGITIVLVLLLEKMQWGYRILFPKGCPLIHRA